jgi:hypothetical protein
LPFSTAVLPADISISGRVRVQLYVQVDRPDADIVVRLVDQYPDGRNMLINDGTRRLRFRNGYTKADETFMSLGQVYPVEVELPFVNYTWTAGHRLKIYLSGNSSTRWDVNLQNGGTMYAAGDTNVAQIQIHHSAQYPAKILLPGNNQLSATGDVAAADQLQMYPNPAGSTVWVKSPLQLERYVILDLTGKTIGQGALTSERIDISGLVSGVYFIRCYGDGFVATRRVVKR